MIDKCLQISTPPEAASTANANAQIDALVKKLAAATLSQGEKRHSSRYHLAIPIPVVPIDEAGEPIERPFQAMSRDISTSGISLTHTRATNAKHLLLVIRCAATKDIRVVVEVTRCRPIGRFYEIAGKFTSRVAIQVPAENSSPDVTIVSDLVQPTIDPPSEST